MRHIFIFLIIGTMLFSCGSPKPKISSASLSSYKKTTDYETFFDVQEYSEDETYGLTGKNPVRVGEKSVSNQVRFLSSLAGPNEEELTFKRVGNCCAYDSDNGFMGKALVDVYEVSYQGLKKPILVYISFYDYEKLYIPKGFIKRI